MLACTIASLLLVGAPDKPDEAARKLRIAYASQYEWREDKLRNVTLDYKWTYAHKDKRGEESTWTGTGQVVVVGNEIKRRHVEGSGWGRTEVYRGIEWVVQRYVRKPFDEAFKDVPVKALEPSISGADRIQAGGIIYVLRNERIVATEINMAGKDKKPEWVRVDFKLEGMGDGYARVREFHSRMREGEKLTETRTLTQREGAEVPMPAAYSFAGDRPEGGKVTLRIEFEEARTDLETPIVVDVGARDLVRKAWGRRYVLPDEIRIEADFVRKPDKALARAGWIDVKGALQVWGMDQIEVEIDMKGGRGRFWRQGVADTVLGHMKQMFRYLKDTPFEEEFKDCGFSFKQQDPENAVVRVVGYPQALALLIRGGLIAGFLAKGSSPDAWTEFKLKMTRENRAMIERMTRSVEGTKLTAKIAYSRIKGVSVPKKFQAIVAPSLGRRSLVCGLVDYTLKKTKVTLPKN